MGIIEKVGMGIIRKGTTRWVYLIGNYAIKFPSLYSWVSFLQGLLGNICEHNRYKWSCKNLVYPQEKLCPVLFKFPLGLFIIMKRAEILNESDFIKFDYNDFVKVNEFYSIPIEGKQDSFGWLNGKIVAVDYGN